MNLYQATCLAIIIRSFTVTITVEINLKRFEDSSGSDSLFGEDIPSSDSMEDVCLLSQSLQNGI